MVIAGALFLACYGMRPSAWTMLLLLCHIATHPWARAARNEMCSQVKQRLGKGQRSEEGENRKSRCQILRCS